MSGLNILEIIIIFLLTINLIILTVFNVVSKKQQKVLHKNNKSAIMDKKGFVITRTEKEDVSLCKKKNREKGEFVG